MRRIEGERGEGKKLSSALLIPTIGMALIGREYATRGYVQRANAVALAAEIGGT
jgi:hypothetical protein